MKKANKNSIVARQQNNGINNINIIRILACLRENYKYIFFAAVFSIVVMRIGEMMGRYIAYIVWG